ncbi:hypothetical protein [Symbiopectobacterium sp. RP]
MWQKIQLIVIKIMSLGYKWAQAKKERVVAIQIFCSQSIWCNQN